MFKCDETVPEEFKENFIYKFQNQFIEALESGICRICFIDFGTAVTENVIVNYGLEYVKKRYGVLLMGRNAFLKCPYDKYTDIRQWWATCCSFLNETMFKTYQKTKTEK
jgi:hypothetical protein